MCLFGESDWACPHGVTAPAKYLVFPISCGGDLKYIPACTACMDELLSRWATKVLEADARDAASEIPNCADDVSRGAQA